MQDKQNAGWYYSQLAEAIKNAPFKVDNSTGSGWLQWLGSNAAKLGVKNSEIQWSGIEEWLDLQGKDKLSKADLSAFLSENGVKVEEVTLGDDRNMAILSEAFGDYEGQYFYDINPHDRSEILFTDAEGYTIEFDELPKRIQAAAEQFSVATGGKTGETQYASEQLPGGERYRELLLTLPAQMVANNAEVVDRADGNFDVVDNDGVLKSFRKWAEAQDYAYGTTQDRQIELNRKRNNYFIPSHFDGLPNILAHVRFNERTDTHGQRVLFLEEIQSDWGQTGKKNGFKGTFPGEVFDAAIKGGMTAEQARADIQHLLDDPRSTDERDTGEQWIRLNQAIGYPGDVDLNEVFHDRRSAGVPMAPFVTDTKAWVGLSLKRMITYAVENGFDRVAWTNGEQQAQRYSLSKSVEQIHWRVRRGEKQIHIDLLSGDGFTLITGQDGIVTRTEGVGIDPYAGKKVDEIIGKDIAKTIIQNESGSLSGDNLKVGGNGMIAFYDQIIPQVANDILKKLGGGKVDRVDIRISPDRGLLDVAGNEYVDLGSVVSQPSFTITPAMRQSVLSKGLPLFRRVDGDTRGFYDPDKRILGLLKTADPTVFLHESGHLFLDAYTKVAALPDAPGEIVADMNTVREWWKQSAGHIMEVLDDDIQQAKDPLRKAEMIEMRVAIDAEGGQDLIKQVADRWQDHEVTEGGTAAWILMHEYFARGAEAYFREGKSPSPEMGSIFEQFRTWLVKSYESIRALKVDLSPEVCGVMDRMLSGAEKPVRHEVDGVYSSILREVKATGLFDANVNRAYAAMQGEFFATLGDKLGIGTKEAYSKYGATIVGSQVALVEGSKMPLQSHKGRQDDPSGTADQDKAVSGPTNDSSQLKKDSTMLDLFGDEVIPGIAQGARKRADTVVQHWQEMADQGVRRLGGNFCGDVLNPLANRVHDALWEQGDGDVVFHLVEEKIKSNPALAKLAIHPDVKRYVSHRLLESAVVCLASHASRGDSLDACASITPQEGKVYVGPIISNNGRTVLQDTGRNTSVEHQIEKLSMPLSTGKVVRIEYANGRANVSEASLGRHGNER